ncbi:3-deoxy-D-manno-octulosonic acid transferase [Marimonas arenosa]|uniref:3-deoxy-D-manno-octulosonic acid transferase n=1 Tax=Marimonas arenosa TaxID=1795305 RepID=A0AAE3WD93_9RHOB|nr:glycosyltransferase N-terminal domain-containing protein [Marimonas arenosa]MDQ2089545.1 3-deoxy-D-manno-octulosonic acid transferase [Marimonas arenosa]
MALGRSISLAAYLTLARRGTREPLSFPAKRPSGTLLWGHATSPARATALFQIAARLRIQRPDLNLIVTAPPELGVPDHLGDQDFFQPLPGDTIGGADAFLDHWRPDLCLWTGGYFMPALLHQAGKRELPLFLIDASEDGLNASHQRWLPELARANLNAFSGFFARGQAAMNVMRRLGVPAEEIEVTGPLQEGSAALPCNESDREEMAQVLAGRPVWLAAMAQRDEMFQVLAAHREVSRMVVRLLLILVPDDETDGPEFRDMLRDTGFRTAVWSEGEMPDETTQILLADTWGEIGLWYRLAPVTFMASSLVPGHGGRDPYEPAALGSAILYGPNVGNYLAAYSRFAAAGAARIVKDSKSLTAALQQCLAPDQAALMASAGWEVASQGAEVTDRVVDLVHDTLDALGAD